MLTAVRLILDGQRSAAATLFAAILIRDLEDFESYNNYGFCLLPDDPEAALSALEKAHSLGDNSSVNLTNRVLALSWLDRSAMALELAFNATQEWGKLDQTPSFLWDFKSQREETFLLANVCPRCYLVRLSVRIAESTGDDVLSARWRRFAEKVGIG